MRHQINIGRVAFVGLLVALAACSGKKRDFAEGDFRTLEGTDGGSTGPRSSGSMTPASSEPGTVEDDAAALDQGSGICEADGSCRCDEGSESCSPTALCADGSSVCDATCPGCFIDGTCVAALAQHPLNQCLICDPTRAPLGWSNIEARACDDGQFCTTDDRCIEGECTGTPRVCDDGVSCNGSSACDEGSDVCTPPANQCPAGALCDVASDTCVDTCTGCLLDGVCLNASAEEPGNPCRVCDPTRSANEYSIATGKSCGSSPTTCSLQDTCNEQGLCQPNHAAEGSPCGDATSSACNQADVCDGNGTCLSRVAANGTPCDDGLFCSVGDQCQGGACISTGNRNCGTDLACDEQSEQCRCQGCVIGNRCLARGAVNAANPCQVCDPARSTTSFSPNVNAVCGSGATECSGQDTCNSQGQCQPNHLPLRTSCASVSGGTCTGNGECVDLLAGRPPILLSDIQRGAGGGFALNGAREFDVSATSVAGGADINGDGLDDIVIGAPSADRNGLGRTGRVYVVFGGARTTPLSLIDIETGRGGFTINGIATDEAVGLQVRAAGDVNGDRLADIVVCSAQFSYVVFGRSVTSEVSTAGLRNATESGFAILNGAGDTLGARVAGAGDVNGDGLDDVIVNVFSGATGARVVFGRTSSAPVDSTNLQGGGFALTYGGTLSSVAGAGDVNGDGLDDLVVGDAGPSSGVGKAYVVFGKSSRTSVALSAFDAGQAGGFAITSAQVGGGAGRAVAGAGDVNADGLADLIVAEPFGPANGNARAGRVYVVFGKANSAAVELSDVESGVGGFVINGVNGDDNTGSDVAGVGDLNGDGLDDVLIGAPLASPGAVSNAGVGYVVFGKATGSPVSLTNVLAGQRGGFAIVGANSIDYTGASVSSGGDINGDGSLDVIIGASLASTGGIANAGITYALFGPTP